MDAKLKRISILAILLIVSIINIAKCQKYTLQSLNGDKIEFQLAENDSQQVLSITYSTDTVHIRDFIGLKKVNILNKKFLIIVYDVAAGTGLMVTRTLLLSASNNKLNQSLDITSSFHDDFLDFDNYVTTPMKVEVRSDYNVNLSFGGDSLVEDNIVAKIHDERSSMHNPKTNYDNNLTSTLEFDKDQNVFFNSHEKFSGDFTIWDPKTRKRIKKYIEGNFAVVKLANYKYCFMNRSWYQVSGESNLTKYTYR